MTFNEYQEKVGQFPIPIKPSRPLFLPTDLLKRRAVLRKYFGEMLHWVAFLATSEGMLLEAVAACNLVLLQDRQEEGIKNGN